MRKSVKITILIVFVFADISLLIASHARAITYQFDNGSLQGWTMQGIYAYSTYPKVYSPNPFTISWDDWTQYPGSIADGPHSDPVGNLLGSASASTGNLVLPPDFPSEELWFIDLISSDVTSDSQWQNITGLSLKLRGDAGRGWAQILLDVTRKSNGEELNIREVNHAGYGVFHDITNSTAANEYSWMNLSPHFGNLSAYNINKVRIRIFGSHKNIAERINIDNVAPTYGLPTLGVEGKVVAGLMGELGNYIYIVYDSDLGPAPELTYARIDFTGSNVKVDYIGFWSPDSQIESLTKVSSQIIEIKFAGFDPAERVGFNLDLDQLSTGTGSPIGDDYVDATVELTFAGLPSTCADPLIGTFTKKDFLTGVATFSCPYQEVDVDDDGFTSDVDCNDDDNTIYPGAPELCDGKDNDCDNQTDEGLSTDIDGDGHYAPGSCLSPADDCDDNNQAIWECNTSVGNEVTVEADTGDVMVTFPVVTGGGDTTITAEECQETPEGITLAPTAPLCVDITTDATFEGEAQVCISYDDTGMTLAEEIFLSMVRCDDQGNCELLICNPPIPVDTENNIVCACTGHFSLFAVGIPSDSDGDLTPDLLDNCPDDYNLWQDDADNDEIGDVCDNCPDVFDPTNQCADLCNGDFDSDRDVDGSDLATFAADFGRTDCGGGQLCEGDFDEDNDVDGSDLAIFVANFGRTDCP